MAIVKGRRDGETKGQRIRCARRRGIAAVEMALVAIPLFLILIGLIDYGLIFLRAQQVAQAARAGARAAILPDATNTSATNAIEASLEAAGIDTFDAPVFTPGDVSTVAAGTAIKVELSVPTSQFNLILTGGVVAIPVPDDLQAAATMAKEGPG